MQTLNPHVTTRESLCSPLVKDRPTLQESRPCSSLHRRRVSRPWAVVTSNILDLIGNTPLLHLKGERVFAKAEFLNPGGSIKDRVALAMLEAAQREGKLSEQSVICEPTSGNTGIGLALVGRIMGYRVRIVMPEGMSEERKKLIRGLGADLVLIPDREGIGGAVRRVEQMAAEDSRLFVPQQFRNPANPRIHYEQTARELWRQMGGDIDCFVAGVGSGGTLQGVGKFLKERNGRIRIVAVEPENRSALMGHEPGLHQIQGIGDGFIPDVLDVSLVDEVVQVSDQAAIDTTRQLSKEYGWLVGISSGANVWAARQLTSSVAGNIATVLVDRAERYFSTALL
jgi:cysteine synthase A